MDRYKGGYAPTLICRLSSEFSDRSVEGDRKNKEIHVCPKSVVSM